jgi:hypothetical protein
MPHHEERPASTLAHGPAKPDDIERVRRDVGDARARVSPGSRAERALGEMEAAAETIRADIAELRDTIAREDGGREPEPPRRG